MLFVRVTLCVPMTLVSNPFCFFYSNSFIPHKYPFQLFNQSRSVSRYEIFFIGFKVCSMQFVSTFFIWAKFCFSQIVWFFESISSVIEANFKTFSCDFIRTSLLMSSNTESSMELLLQ